MSLSVQFTASVPATCRGRTSCPHCSGPLVTRTSRHVTPTVREVHLECRALECGAAFSAQLAITHEIRPSGAPRPGLNLPRAKPRIRTAPVPANDDTPIEAARA